MKVLGNGILDKRVNSKNYILELSVKEYYDLSIGIIKQNEFQRKKVRSSKSIYSLLHDDILLGCLMPSIVLAFYKPVSDPSALVETLLSNLDSLIILDGLQRTFTIHELVDEINKNDDKASMKILEETMLRIEVYINISRTNVLYRMLTLNTGHTQMTTRHQLEIVFADLLSNPIKDITIVKEIDPKIEKQIGVYAFDQVIDGFTSYLEGEYLPIDRSELLDYMKDLNKVIEKNAQDSDLFGSFIISFNNFVKRIDDIIGDWKVEDDLSTAYGLNTYQIFAKSIVLAGYGAALYKLMQRGDINSFDDVNKIISEMDTQYVKEGLIEIIKNLDYIKSKAKKIGNDHRCYFHFIFLKFFSDDRENRGKLMESVKAGFKSFAREAY
ncbi:hypothetical protein [Treponema sp.]|uniref:hypothetical protein n=1 Tax=Treponema sp. TaxID=166 RepID=UPI00298E1197|nr:hypothetical protein [Treponema sp.]